MLYNLSTAANQSRYIVSFNYGGDNQVHHGWDFVAPNALVELAGMECRPAMTDRAFALSPILWGDGRRREDKFWEANCLFLDIEDGLPLRDALWLSREFDGCVYTTRNHNRPKGAKPASDRYRVVVGLDGTINDLAAWKRIHASLIDLVWGMDAATSDGARFYRGSVPNGFIIPRLGKRVLSITKLLNYASANILPVAAHRHGVRRTLPQHTATTAGVYDQRLHTEIVKWMGRQPQEWHGKNTCQRVYSVLMYSWNRSPSFEAVLGTVSQLNWVQAWFARKPYQERTFEQTVWASFEDWARGQLRQGGYRPVQPANTLVELDDANLHRFNNYQKIMVQRYRQQHQYPATAEGNATHQLLAYASSHYRKSILDVPCGNEKTSAARCYLAAMANDQNRFWLVKRTRRDCREDRNLIQQLAPNLDVGFLAGFDAKDCQAGLTSWMGMYGKTSPCRSCAHSTTCDFGQAVVNEQGILDKPVVVLTHAKFIGLEAQGRIPLNVSIIIDEQMSRFESYTFHFNRWPKIKRLLSRDMRLRVVPWLRALYKGLKSGGAAQVFRPSDWKMDYLSTVKKIFKVGSQHGDVDSAWEFLSFFRNVRSLYWAMREGKNIHFVRSTIELDVPNRILILDGSATFSPVAWRGFTILRVTQHRQRRYPNIQIRALPYNPTKRQLTAHINQLQSDVGSILSANPSAKVFVASNRNMSKLVNVQRMVNNLRSRPATVHMTRGSVTGSNAARGCDCCVIAMSLFTSVADYVLRACVATGAQEISADRIWRNKRPKMRQGRFDDEDIDTQYRRQYIDELYQAVMRGVVRLDPEAHYTVLAFVPALWMAMELEQLLPGFRLVGVGNTSMSRQLNGYTYLREHGLAGISSYPRLAQIMGYSGMNGRIREELTTLLAALADQA
jgi:hypothetical protein